MSWLNTANIANLAKSALKEAQKTIDKALDIKDVTTVPNTTDQEFTSPKESGCTSVEDVVVSEPNTNTGYSKQNLLSSFINGSSILCEEENNEKYVEVTTKSDLSGVSSTSLSQITTRSENDNVDVETSNQITINLDRYSSDHEKYKGHVVVLSEIAENIKMDETSASASGDEIETTTSSDIEIISSPHTAFRKVLPQIQLQNNDSKIHSRGPSASSSDSSLICIGNDESQNSLDCKIFQLNRLLEARDNQILELTRKCTTFSEKCDQFKLQLSRCESERLAMNDTICRQGDDFAIRLSSIEKRYQQVLAEKEMLSKKLDQSHLTHENRENILADLREKTDIIEQLRYEGEKLSKQNLQQSTIIKKLRAQEKEEEAHSKLLKSENEELKNEIERLNKILTAKEDSEKKQNEAVRELTGINRELEKELAVSKVMIREKLAEIDSVRSALTDAEKHLMNERTTIAVRDFAETERNLSAEMSLRQRLQLEFETSSRLFEEEKKALTIRCQELAQTLAEIDYDRAKERERMHIETSRLMQRLQDAECRSDDLSQALTTATKPLLRQIDVLQHTLATQTLSEEKSEQVFKEKFRDIDNELLTLRQKEIASKEACQSMQTRLETLLEELTVAQRNSELLSVELEQEKNLGKTREETLMREITSLVLLKNQLEEELNQLRHQYSILRNNHEQLRIELEEDKKQNTTISARLLDKELEFKSFSANNQNAFAVGKITTEIISRSSSPTPSLEKLSLADSFAESHSSNPWTSDEMVRDEAFLTPVPKSSLYETMRSTSYAAAFESLQAQLKNRDGEITQLQLELENQNKIRDSLTKELTDVINLNQEFVSRLNLLETINIEHEDLKTKYNALLQMYGEKIEETEELRLDLLDIKEMYKTQIDQLMKR